MLYYGYLGMPFQFTHPGRGATNEANELLEIEWVSIHAPREGCDPPIRSHPAT